MAQSEQIRECLIHTGQHFDERMSSIFFEELRLPRPGYELGIHGGTHAQMLGRMMVALEEVLREERPDLVLVYGDTNSTLAGALVAGQLGVSLAHVEAGLRSFNRTMPEERNRVLTDHLSARLFCPTQRAVEWLAAEGIREGVSLSGDLMYDSVLQSERLSLAELAATLPLPEGPFELLTLHRAESCDDPEEFLKRLRWLQQARRHPILWPIHPRARQRLSSLECPPNLEGITLVEPLGYRVTLSLLAHAERLFTDSGGMQKEAFFLETPCVTLRSETEWPETIEAGWNQLWSPDEPTRPLPSERRAPGAYFGAGDAAEKILAGLLQ